MVAASITAGWAAGWLTYAPNTAAFPLIEPSDAPGAQPAELSPPNARDPFHQLQLTGTLAPPPSGGWTIIPQVGLFEAFNDNIFQVQSPRRFDLTSVLAPAIAVAGDTPRLRLTASYSPTLEMNAINGSQNALTQQFNAIGLLTLVPDRLYLDMRAIGGVQATNGLAGNASLWTSGPASVSTSGFGGAGNGLGLAKNNRTQTMSFGLSPYTIGRLGRYGDYRLGASIDVSHFATSNGFFVPPFGGGSSGQTLVTTQQVGQFTSGDYLTNFQNRLDLALSQSQTTTDGSTSQSNPQTGVILLNGNTSSHRASASNQLVYHADQNFAFFGSLGWEVIRYRGANALDIDGATWSIGTTVTPNPNSFATLSYGRHEGANTFSLSARYAATARTALSASYDSTVGTQLENLQRQLDVAGPNGNGGLVNRQTGGTAFNGTLLNVQPGVYRFNNLALNSTTSFARDTLALALGYTKQTSLGRGLSGSTTEAEYASGQWIHALDAVMTLSGAASYTRQQFSNGNGRVQSVAFSAVLQYMLNETLTASARYLFNDQIASRPGLSLYQDLFILGITKQF